MIVWNGEPGVFHVALGQTYSISVIEATYTPLRCTRELVLLAFFFFFFLLSSKMTGFVVISV